jgi:hypothetical protein
MRTILVCALAVFSLASIATAEASCRDTRQACERLCRDIRRDLNRIEGDLHDVEGSTRTSGQLSREEAAACSDPDRRTRVQGVGTYGHQTGYRSGFNCNSRSASTLHRRNVDQTMRLRSQVQELRIRADRNDCLDEIPLIERIWHALI